MLTKFNEIGYEVTWQLISAWDYGVAQKRERVFIVGVRKDLGVKFGFPQPLEGDYRTKVLRDVIGDLPEPYPNHKPEDKLPKYVQNVIDGKSKTNFGKMPINDGERPAATVLASYATKKPNEITSIDGHNRRFTVREALRIQSVPDSYVLPDNIAVSNQYKIVGNGIASRVAWYIGKALAEQLNP